MALRPQDELLHLGGGELDEPDRLEFNFYDIPVRLGGLFRLDSHPVLGYTTMTACLYLPDGRAGFVSERSGIGPDPQFDAGGLQVEVLNPFQELHVSYDGKLLLLEDPAAMLHPERPAEHPQVDAEVHLTYSAISTLYEEDEAAWITPGGRDRSGSGPHRPFGDSDAQAAAPGTAGGHYEQLVSVFGSVRVGDDRWKVDGLGLRSHRWGPEPSPVVGYRRRLAANMGPSLGFMASHTVAADGSGLRRGFVWDGTALHVCSGLAVSTSWSGADRLPRDVQLTLKAGEQKWHATGRVLSLLVRPDVDSEDGNETRICEGLTEWRLGDGQIGYGVAQYADRIVDGLPTGLAE